MTTPDDDCELVIDCPQRLNPIAKQKPRDENPP